MSYTPFMNWHELVLYCWRFREGIWSTWEKYQKKYKKNRDCIAILMELDRPNPIDGYPLFDSLLKSKIQESIKNGETGIEIDLMKNVINVNKDKKDKFIYIFYHDRILPILTQNEFKINCGNWVDFNNICLMEKHSIYGSYNEEESIQEVPGETLIDKIRPEFLNQTPLLSKKTLEAKEKLYDVCRGKRLVVFDGDIKNINNAINLLF